MRDRRPTFGPEQQTPIVGETLVLTLLSDSTVSAAVGVWLTYSCGTRPTPFAIFFSFYRLIIYSNARGRMGIRLSSTSLTGLSCGIVRPWKIRKTMHATCSHSCRRSSRSLSWSATPRQPTSFPRAAGRPWSGVSGRTSTSERDTHRLM